MKINVLYKKNIKILSFKMNIFSVIIINLLFLISNKVSDMKTINNSSNKEKKIRLLEDAKKNNSLLISIEAQSDNPYYYLSSKFFKNYNGIPKELYLNNNKINITSNSIFLNTGNYTLEIVYGDKILTTCNSMFRESSYLQSIDLSNFDTSKVTDMQHMFESSSVKSLDLSNFDTSNVTNTTYMFCGCTSLKSLDLSNFNTSNVRDMTYMFQSSSLQSLDLSNFDTSKVTDMRYMFCFCS